MEILEAIRSNYLFSGLSNEQLMVLNDIFSTKSFLGGEQLTRQFERSSDLMILLSGSARITSFSGETIAEVGAGSLIGEMALIDDQPRSATVTAIGDVKVAVLPHAQLQSLLERDSDMAAKMTMNIAKVLVQRLRAANMQLDEALVKASR